jgi:predicted  nucleic acid-binding Zn-ribbon protein
MDLELKQQFEKLDQRLDKTDSKLDRMEKFIMGDLVTKQELSELTEKVTTLTESVNKLTTAVDNLAKRINDFDKEHAVLKHQVSAIQDWIREASKKVGIEFKL